MSGLWTGYGRAMDGLWTGYVQGVRANYCVHFRTCCLSLVDSSPATANTHKVMQATEGTALVAGKEKWRTGAFYKNIAAGPKHIRKGKFSFRDSSWLTPPASRTLHARASALVCMHPKSVCAVVSQATFIPVSAK